MKILPDEMHAPAVAAELRTRGHDAVAVKERPEMIGLGDRDLLLTARNEGRALVTENVKDFATLHKSRAAVREQQAGLVFTHARRFPRHARNHVAVLTDALAHLLAARARTLHDVESFVWWLEPIRRK